jgi:hypothetical protein
VRRLPFLRPADTTGGAAHSPDRLLVWVALVLLLLFGGFVGLLWGLGLLDVHGRTSNAQVVAATLALGGGLVATSLTFIGVLLKHSIDERTLRQTENTEGRLRLETSIRAVELLTENGKPATATRQAGALFVLASLNQLDFALALLREIWPKREISPDAALWVVDRALLSGDEMLQVQASQLLYSNANSLSTAGGYEFPDSVNQKWTNDIPSYARSFVLNAYMEMLLSRPCDDWDLKELTSVVVQFDEIRKVDASSRLRYSAILCLDALLNSRRFGNVSMIIFGLRGEIDIDELRSEVGVLLSEMDDESSYTLSALTDRLRAEWGRPEQ